MINQYFKNHKIYVGYFNRNIYAVSEDKKLVKYYMEYHRRLDKGEYKIKEEDVSDIDMVTKYDNYIIDEFYKYYIPRIDATIIEFDCSSLNNDLQSLITSMNRFLLLISHLKNTDKEIDVIVKAINIFAKYLSNKKYNKLKKENIRSHPILHCNIREYNRYIANYNEMVMMNNRYKDAWYRE